MEQTLSFFLFYYFEKPYWIIYRASDWLENSRVEDKCSFITARLDKCSIGSQSVVSTVILDNLWTYTAKWRYIAA